MEQQQSGNVTSKTIQRVNATHTFQNVTLVNEVTRSARFQHQQIMRQQQLNKEAAERSAVSGLTLNLFFVFRTPSLESPKPVLLSKCQERHLEEGES